MSTDVGDATNLREDFAHEKRWLKMGRSYKTSARNQTRLQSASVKW